MRLVTWNCYRGDVARRADRLFALQPDLIALQECRCPATDVDQMFWRGELEEQGVAVVALNDLRIEAHPVKSDVPPTVLPVHVHAQVPFTLINFWALPLPSYEAYALKALTASVFGFPTVVLGDFNSTPALASQRVSSTRMIRQLREEFGLVSAYHAHHRIEHGREPHPSYFHRRQEGSPFHIDYCFVPHSWVKRIRDVSVGAFCDWRDSDHRPLVVDLDLDL